MKYIIFIILISCFAWSEVTHAQSLVLSPKELSSAVWIIRQYGLNIPQNQSLCNYTSTFTCDSTSNGYNIIRIQIAQSSPSSIVNNSAPDYTLQSFTFPSLMSFTHNPQFRNPTVYNTSLNILDRLMNLNTLATIIVSYEPSINRIPSDFSSLTSLNSIQLNSNPNLYNIPSFFNNTVATTIAISDTDKDLSFIFDPSLRLPNLGVMVMGFSPRNTTYNLSKYSFPQLFSVSWTVFSPNLVAYMVNLTIGPSIQTLSLIGNFNVTLLDVSLLISMSSSGKVILSRSDFSLYPSLLSLSISSNPGLSSFEPFKNVSTLSTFTARYCDIQSIPTQIPPNLRTLDLQYNRINETLKLDDTRFNFPPNLQLLISGNTNITGTIPQSFCSLKTLYIQGVGVTGLPDCLNCYLNGSNIFTSLTVPPGFACNISLTSRFFPQIFGVTILNGTNLGYGGPAGVVAIIPNSQISYTIPRSLVQFTLQTNLTIPLSSQNLYNVMFESMEAGITVSRVSTLDGLIFNISMSWYNYKIPHPVTVDSKFCGLLNQTPDMIQCQTIDTVSRNQYIVNVSNEYYANQFLFKLNDKITISSIQQTNNNLNLTINGLFGFDYRSQSILINGTSECTITFINSTLINCTMKNQPPQGQATLLLSLPNFGNFTTNLLYFNSPNNNNGGVTTSGGGSGGNNPQLECQQSTFNCYGNGQCNINGQCQCNDGFNQIDNCLTQYIKNTTIKPNITSPTVEFDIQGITFDFEMYSIQQIGIDDTVISELLISDYSWITNTTSNSTTYTSVQYQLNLTNSTNYQNLNVTTQISFSSLQWSIPFGNQNLTINPNSIKITVNISNWVYTNNLAQLRVLFKTTINNQQFVSNGCDQQTIESFSYMNGGIEYLRVVKDNIQFNGRFLDYALSDGRPTYSKTQFISSTPLDNNRQRAIIGIYLPQCRQCLLDPDFTPLLVSNNNNNNNNCKSNNNSWKIITGSIVGGVAFIALATILIVKLKNSSSIKIKVNRAKSILMKKKQYSS